MIESDTIKLLRECDAGIKMGIESINEVLKYVDDSRLHDVLTKCRDDHLGLQAQIQEMLDEFHDNGKEPNSIAKSMSVDKDKYKTYDERIRFNDCGAYDRRWQYGSEVSQ